jgi:Domain of unknown function (DUF1876)
VSLREKGEKTEAEVVLDADGRQIGGWGRARRSPGDPDVAQIGDELATARALSDLSHKLLEEAASAIESFEGHEVHVHA